MFCRACWVRGKQLRLRGTRSREKCDSGGNDRSSRRETPLRRLLNDSSAFSEVAPLDRELQWATQPYTAVPGVRAAAEAESEREARTRSAPLDASVVLFPGQGTQFVGMGQRLATVPTARRLYDLASEVLGWDVWRVCTEGPAEELARRAQPAVLVTALAALERARDERPAAVQRARATAGFSLGELAALVFAGALPLQQALRVCEVRAAAMNAAAAARPGGMLTLWLAPDAELAAALRGARDAAAERGVAEPVCLVANYLYPGCKVVAGDDEALRWLEQHGRVLGVRRAARLQVAGAFHSPLMAPALAPVREALRACDVSAPRLPVLACCSARPYRDAADVRRGLERLAVRPVRWEQTLHALFARPRAHAQPLTLALGPGRALRASLKQVNARAWDASVQIDV